MRYITFSNKLGQVHKMWVDKEGGSFICFKVDDINAKADDELEMDLSKPYKMWADKKYKTKEDAETAILRYVDAGVKAKIFLDKNIVD